MPEHPRRIIEEALKGSDMIRVVEERKAEEEVAKEAPKEEGREEPRRVEKGESVKSREESQRPRWVAPPEPPREERRESEFEEVLPIASEGLRDAIRWFESLPEEERRRKVEKFLSWVSSLLKSGDPIRAGVEVLNAFAQHDELIVYFLYLFRPGFKIYAARLLASVANLVGRLARG